MIYPITITSLEWPNWDASHSRPFGAIGRYLLGSARDGSLQAHPAVIDVIINGHINKGWEMRAPRVVTQRVTDRYNQMVT